MLSLFCFLFFSTFVFHFVQIKIMKQKIFYILILLCIPVIIYGNTNTKEYGEKLLASAMEKYADGDYAKSLEMLAEVQTLASSNSWDDMLASALHHIGSIYSDLLDYEKAMDYFLESYKITMKNSNEQQEMLTLNNMAQIYLVNNDIEKTKEYVERAYKIAQRLKDTVRMGKFASNLGAVANEAGDLDLAADYLDIAISILENYPEDTLSILTAKYVKAKNLYLKQKYDEAERLIIESLRQISDIRNESLEDLFFFLLSKVYQQKGEIQKAIHAVKQSLNSNPNLSVKVVIYEQLSRLYRENNSLLLALQYQDTLIVLQDSLTRLNNMGQVKNNQVRMDLLTSEKELSKNRAKQRIERTFFIAIISLISVLALVGIWVFRIRSTKNKQQKIIAELELKEEKNQKLLLEQQLREQEMIALLEQERLNNEIDVKNRELVAKTLFQSDRNELFEEILQAFSEVPNQFRTSEMQSIIQKLKMQLKESSINESGFLLYFEQINPHFLSVLKEKHPGLSIHDMRLASYIYLNLNAKEMATVLNILPSSLKKKKQRLAGKMGMDANELYDYLISLI